MPAVRTLTVYVFNCDPPCNGPVIFATYSELKGDTPELMLKIAGDAVCRNCGKLHTEAKDRPITLVGSVEWEKTQQTD
jgi:hypothetical protein